MASERIECNDTEKVAIEVFNQDKNLLDKFNPAQKDLIRLEYLKSVKQIETSKLCKFTQAELKELLIKTVLNNKDKFKTSKKQTYTEKINIEDNSKILSEIQSDSKNIQDACKLWTNCITESSEWSYAIGKYTQGFNESQLTSFNDEVGTSAENAIISIEERAKYLESQASRISYERQRDTYTIDDYDGGSKVIGTSKGEALRHIQKEIKILSEINTHREEIGNPYYIFTALQIILWGYLGWKVVKTISNPIGDGIKRVRRKADLANLKESKKIKTGNIIGNIRALLRFIGHFPVPAPISWATWVVQAPASLMGGNSTFTTDLVGTVNLEKEKLKEVLDINDIKLFRERKKEDEKELRYTFIDYLTKLGFGKEADELKSKGNLSNFWGRAYEILRKINSSSKPASGRIRRALRTTGNNVIRKPIQELNPLHNPRNACLDIVLRALESSFKAQQVIYDTKGEEIDITTPTDFMKKLQNVVVNQGKKNETEFNKYIDDLKKMKVFPTSQDEIKTELIKIATKGTSFNIDSESELDIIRQFENWLNNEKAKTTHEHIDFGNENDPRLSSAKEKINSYRLYTSNDKAKVVDLLLKRLREEKMRLTMKEVAIIINNIDNGNFDENDITITPENQLTEGTEYNFNNLEKVDISSLGARRLSEVIACKDFGLGDYLDKLEQKIENIKKFDGQLSQAKLTQASSQNPSGLNAHITQLEGEIKKEKDLFIEIVRDMEVNLGKLDSLVEGTSYEDIKANLPKNLRNIVLKKADEEDIAKAEDELRNRGELGDESKQEEEIQRKLEEVKSIANGLKSNIEESKKTIDGLKVDLGKEVLPEDSEINNLESLGADVSQARTLLLIARQNLQKVNGLLDEANDFASTLEQDVTKLLERANEVNTPEIAEGLLKDAKALEVRVGELKTKTELAKDSVKSTKEALDQTKDELKKAEEKAVADVKKEIDKKVLELSNTKIGELRDLIDNKLQERDQILRLIDVLRGKIESINNTRLNLEGQDQQLLNKSRGLLSSLESELNSINKILSEAGVNLSEYESKKQNLETSISKDIKLKDARDALNLANSASQKFDSANNNLSRASQKLDSLKKYEGAITELIAKLETLKNPKIEQEVKINQNAIDVEYEEVLPGDEELESAKLYVSHDKVPKIEALEERIRTEREKGENISGVQVKNALSNIISVDNLDIEEIQNGNIFELKEGIELFNFEKLEKVKLSFGDGKVELVVGNGNKEALEAWEKFRTKYERLDKEIGDLKASGKNTLDKIKERQKLIEESQIILDSFPEEIRSAIIKVRSEKIAELKNNDSKGFFDAVFELLKKAEFKHK